MRITLGLLFCLSTTLAWAEHYGAPLTMKGAVPLETAVKQLDGTAAATVLVESKVDKVCAQAGCWLGLKSGSGEIEIHVTFKGEAFFVPSTLIGKTVHAQGVLKKATMTIEETKQYVADAGGDPATVKQPGVRYEMVASGLEVI